MGKLRNQLNQVRFFCAGCDERFEVAPTRIEDCAEDTWHPWRYFAPCPICADDAPQDRQHRHLLKMWANATGPKSAEGKASVTENLAGHPTPEEARRTRFNALKHGLEAKVATYWPAKPGKYPHCNNCEYLHGLCNERQIACLKRTELLLKHQIAFEAGDPSLLVDLRAGLHANVTALIEDMILALAQDGVRLKTPEWYFDSRGVFRLAKGKDPDGNAVQIFKIEQHPLLRTLSDMIHKLDLGLAQQGMTPKVQDDNDVIRGHLQGNAERGEQALDYQKRQTELLEGLGALIIRSRAMAEADPILLEHRHADDT